MIPSTFGTPSACEELQRRFKASLILNFVGAFPSEVQRFHSPNVSAFFEKTKQFCKRAAERENGVQRIVVRPSLWRPEHDVRLSIGVRIPEAEKASTRITRKWKQFPWQVILNVLPCGHRGNGVSGLTNSVNSQQRSKLSCTTTWDIYPYLCRNSSIVFERAHPIIDWKTNAPAILQRFEVIRLNRVLQPSPFHGDTF